MPGLHLSSVGFIASLRPAAAAAPATPVVYSEANIASGELRVTAGAWIMDTNAAYIGGQGAYTNTLNAFYEFDVLVGRNYVVLEGPTGPDARTFNVHINGTLLGNYSQAGPTAGIGIYAEFAAPAGSVVRVTFVSGPYLLLDQTTISAR